MFEERIRNYLEKNFDFIDIIDEYIENSIDDDNINRIIKNKIEDEFGQKFGYILDDIIEEYLKELFE